MNIADALKRGAETLRTQSIPSPEREASLLLQHVLNRDSAFIFAHPDHGLNAMESILFKAVIKRRAAHEPFQYIVGRQEFYGLHFEVTPAVLIPRPETEVLVEDAVVEFKGRGAIRFCEIGIGSGCIAISLLVNLPEASGTGIDISDAALAVSLRNAERHAVAERLGLTCGSLFDDLDGKTFDLIVSNPPYVPDGELEKLQPEVKDFEPRNALSGGEDGLDIIRKLIDISPKHLRDGGLLYIEIGWEQSARVNELFDPGLWQSVEFLTDLQGIPRIVKSRLN